MESGERRTLKYLGAESVKKEAGRGLKKMWNWIGLNRVCRVQFPDAAESLYSTVARRWRLGRDGSVFWVDEIVVANIIVDTTGALYGSLPPGTLYTCAPLLSGYLQSPVFAA